MIQHGGKIDGERAFMLLYLKQGLGVALAGNMNGVHLNLKEVGTLQFISYPDI